MSQICIEKGELLLFTSGECSDYKVHDLYRATRTLDLPETLERYLRKNPGGETHVSRFDGMLTFLQEERCIEMVPYREVYLGADDTISERLLGARETPGEPHSPA